MYLTYIMLSLITCNIILITYNILSRGGKKLKINYIIILEGFYMIQKLSCIFQF